MHAADIDRVQSGRGLVQQMAGNRRRQIREHRQQPASCIRGFGHWLVQLKRWVQYGKMVRVDALLHEAGSQRAHTRQHFALPQMSQQERRHAVQRGTRPRTRILRRCGQRLQQARFADAGRAHQKQQSRCGHVQIDGAKQQVAREPLHPESVQCQHPFSPASRCCARRVAWQPRCGADHASTLGQRHAAAHQGRPDNRASTRCAGATHGRISGCGRRT